MVSPSYLFLSTLLANATGAIDAADDDIHDEVGAWVWRNSRTAASLVVATNSLPAASLPLPGRAAAARDPAADTGDRGKKSGAGVDGALRAFMSNKSTGASKVESRERTVATKTTAVKREDGIGDNQLEAEAVRRGKLATQKTATLKTSSTASKKRKDDACRETPSGGVRVIKRARGGHNDKDEVADSFKTTNNCVGVCNGAAATKETSLDRKGRGNKICSHGDCTNISRQGGVCTKHGAKRKTCSRDGCTTNAQQGGVCKKHGAKTKICSRDGCTTNAQQGGVCYKHGGKGNSCSRDGYTTNAQQGGVCYKHGGKGKSCSRDGCTNGAVKGGVCRKHGEKGKTCSRDGCTNLSVQGGVCNKHGAKRKTCSRDGCTNNSQKGGVCYRHGKKAKPCSRDGCTNNAVKGGVCRKHGAKGICSRDGCTKNAQKGGVCKKHGARVIRCSSDGCTNCGEKGGVCPSAGQRVTPVAGMDAPTIPSKEESDTSTGQG